MIDFNSTALSITPSVGHRVGESLTVEADIRISLEQVTAAYGFKGFMVMVIPAPTCHRLIDATVMTNWPGDILRDYDDAGLMRGSPVFDRLRRSTIPFTYDTHIDAHRRKDGKAGTVLSLFARVSLRSGIYIPVHDIYGTCGVIAFGGDRETVSTGEMKELTFVAGSLFNRLSELKESKASRPAVLSRREIECLHWAAAGKTTTEMARILTLSEYTVNHYLSRATRKLDSVNRVQTVAKAIRAGLIQ